MLKPKGWCDKPTKLQFHSDFYTENFDALNRYEPTDSTVELGLLGLTGLLAVTLTK